jgi:hypothetical protein
MMGQPMEDSHWSQKKKLVLSMSSLIETNAGVPGTSTDVKKQIQ